MLPHIGCSDKLFSRYFQLSIKSIQKNKVPDSPERVKNEAKAPAEKQIVRLKSGVDRPFLLLLIVLLCIGTTMVFSSSYAYAKSNYAGDSYFFSRKQIIWALISIAAMMGVSRVDYLFIKKYAKFLFLVSVGILMLVPLIGYTSGGAKRWISLGFTSFQPSELVKAMIVLYYADYAVKNQDKMHEFKYGIAFYGSWTILICGFLYLQPHLSGMIIMVLLTAVMMYTGGTRVKHLLFCGGGAVAAAIPLMLLTEHGRSRIEVWRDPLADITGKGWQPLQSLYAIGSGGFWGVGLGQSRQKHLWLPEPQNDYIFSILCEEMGFVFATAVLLLFLALVWRGFYIARNAPSRFASMVVIGLVSQIAIQVLLNIAVVTNSIPSTGISLPFFSYGGTSLLMFMAEMGIVLNISRYSYIEKS